ELDDHAEHVVVQQRIWSLSKRAGIQSDVERVGTEPVERADIALWRRCPCPVVHRERQFATIRQFANAALGRFSGSIALEGLEPKAKADLIVCRLKLRAVPNACNGHTANGDRIIDDIRENRILTGSREDA